MALAARVAQLLFDFEERGSLALGAFRETWREARFAEVHHVVEACADRRKLGAREVAETRRALLLRLFALLQRALVAPGPLARRVGALFALCAAAETQTLRPREPVPLAPNGLRAALAACRDARDEALDVGEAGPAPLDCEAVLVRLISRDAIVWTVSEDWLNETDELRAHCAELAPAPLLHANLAKMLSQETLDRIDALGRAADALEGGYGDGDLAGAREELLAQRARCEIVLRRLARDEASGQLDVDALVSSTAMVQPAPQGDIPRGGPAPQGALAPPAGQPSRPLRWIPEDGPRARIPRPEPTARRPSASAASTKPAASGNADGTKPCAQPPRRAAAHGEDGEDSEGGSSRGSGSDAGESSFFSALRASITDSASAAAAAAGTSESESEDESDQECAADRMAHAVQVALRRAGAPAPAALAAPTPPKRRKL